VPAGSAQGNCVGIPNLNLLTLFQQVRGGCPPPSVFQKELPLVCHAVGQALPDPSPGQPDMPDASERRWLQPA